jgi:signal transduction histidine kinase
VTENDERPLLEALDAEDWGIVQEAVEHAGDILRGQQVDDLLRAELAPRLLHLSGHPKWEVRKAVAHAVLFLRHETFPAVIARVVEDDNAWVREAARKTLQRREGLTRADIHGDGYSEAIVGVLAALERRYGLRARRAAVTVADHLHHRFVREACHEIIRIISPLDASLLNLERELAAVPDVPEHTREHARRAQARVRLIAEFLENLRTFTAETAADFTSEVLLPVMREAVELAFGLRGSAASVAVNYAVDGSLALEGKRSRLLQAFINIIVNAIEACDGQDRPCEVAISAEQQTGTHIKLTVADNGCGMSEEALKDCTLLYSTSKPNGMGFGLPLAKKIIEIDHRGTLSIESTRGVGTTVLIVLPVEQGHPDD